ncbi:hypothetical protein [Bdellovibrio sp. HCB288]|uniref:hypothetical protein n=1 Tax=Bdellovibrio sp. HCB288 TaxID=3394355 RepID=UPI0039B58AEF
MSKLILVSAVLGFSISAFAQTSKIIMPESTSGSAPAEQSSVLKQENVINKKFAEDKDITDARMKAESGSLSRYSLKASLSYSGPPVGDLSNPNQPNPDGSICACETSLGGSLSARYRFDSKTALSVGTGASALTPFQGVKRYDVRNPYLGIDRSSRVGDLQMRNGVKGTYVTNQTFREIGEYAAFGYDSSVIYNFGTTGFAAGVDASFDYYFFDRGPDVKNKYEMKTGRYSVAFFPQVKYNFTDKFSMYSSVAVGFNNPRGTEDAFTLWNRTLSSRIGLGYAIRRDIFFAPFLNFYPDTLTADSTTVNFATTFSIL